MPGIGQQFQVQEEVLGLKPGTILTVVGYYGGRIAFRTQSGATAVKHPNGSRYVSITFSPSEVRRQLTPVEQEVEDGVG